MPYAKVKCLDNLVQCHSAVLYLMNIFPYAHNLKISFLNSPLYHLDTSALDSTHSLNVSKSCLSLLLFTAHSQERCHFLLDKAETVVRIDAKMRVIKNNIIQRDGSGNVTLYPEVGEDMVRRLHVESACQ